MNYARRDILIALSFSPCELWVLRVRTQRFDVAPELRDCLASGWVWDRNDLYEITETGRKELDALNAEYQQLKLAQAGYKI